MPDPRMGVRLDQAGAVICSVKCRPMLRNIKQFFDRAILPAGKGEDAQHALRVATAALLFEVMRSDGDLKDVERHAVNAAIQSSFDLAAEETASLLHLAEAEAGQATDYYQFTALINQHFTPEQKIQVVENLWLVAAADLEIDRFERTLVHKVADLLHVPRPAQIAARERALRAVHHRKSDRPVKQGQSPGTPVSKNRRRLPGSVDIWSGRGLP